MDNITELVDLFTTEKQIEARGDKKLEITVEFPDIHSYAVFQHELRPYLKDYLLGLSPEILPAPININSIDFTKLNLSNNINISFIIKK